MKSIEITSIEPKTASTLPITTSPISGTEIFVCVIIFAVFSELSNSDDPITVALIDVPSSYVFLPGINSSMVQFYLQGILIHLSMFFLKIKIINCFRIIYSCTVKHLID